MRQIKLALCGDNSTGKTRIYRALFQMPISDLTTYYPTMDPDINTIRLATDLEIYVWDLPGTIETVREQNYLDKIEGAVIVFDITREETYANVNMWIELVWQVSPGVPIILVANKYDLKDITPNAEVLIKKAEQLVNKINAQTAFWLKLVIVSATQDKSAYRVFNALFGAIEQKYTRTMEMKRSKKIVEASVSMQVPERQKIAPAIDEPDIATILDQVPKNASTEIVMQKVTTFLKENREIRKVFSKINPVLMPLIINTAASDSDWLIERNFLYLLVYSYIDELFKGESIPDAQHWAKIFTDKFLEDVDTFNRFLELDKFVKRELLKKFINQPDYLAPDGEWTMEIYQSYRAITYKASV